MSGGTSGRSAARNDVAIGRRNLSRVPLDGWERALLATLVVLLAALFAFVPGFWSGLGGFMTLTEDFLPFGLVALGLATVILAGGIDLSVGSVASLSAIVMAELWSAGLSIWVAALLGIVSGAGLGLLNGLIVTRLGTEPLIATLATSFIYASCATALAGASPPSGFPAGFNALGAGALGGVLPYQLMLFAVLALGVGVLLSRTAFGRKVVMIGYNREAATWSGIRTGRVLLATYVLSGITAAIAGIVLAAYYSAVRPDMGSALLLTTITAVVLGGVSIFGGDGRIVGVVMAVLILGFLHEGLLIDGVSDMVITMVTGAILLAAIAIRNAVSPSRGQGVGRLLARLRRARPPEKPTINKREKTT